MRFYRQPDYEKKLAVHTNSQCLVLCTGMNGVGRFGGVSAHTYEAFL